MDSFFLSKLKPREQRGAHLIPHSPTCPPPVPAPSRLCAPFARKAERGWDTASGFGHAPRFACPLCAYTGDGAPLLCLRSLPSTCHPCTQAGGRGGMASWFTCVPGCVSPCAQSRGRVVP